jgi:two-component system, response regulator, stage 0 sporulation protein F
MLSDTIFLMLGRKGVKVMKSGASILIVEDNQSLRSLYSEELRDEGYRTMLAASGKEALEILKTHKPDLIILDIVMPVMDGMEALGLIVSRHLKIPVILYSSYPHYKEEFISWAADAYLTKSSDLTELKTVVKSLLKKNKNLENVLNSKKREEVETDENLRGKESKKGGLQLTRSPG